ncbi:MAG: family 43 glycosylhydrolase [Actinocrinis sp.]
MHRSITTLPKSAAVLVVALVAMLISALTAGPAGAAGYRPSASASAAASSATTTAAEAAAYTTTVTNFDSGGNQVVRFDTDGNAVDAHDGMTALFGGTYYLYGTAYDCGFSWQTTGAPFCGFKVYSSTDLVHWTDRGLLFNPAGSVWQTRCNGSTYGCFRPHVVYDAGTGMYVLWINVYDNSVGYRVFTSSNPTGPFTEAAVPTLAVNDNAPVGGVNNGDHTVFVDDDGTAYVVYTDWRGNGDLVVERLNASDLSGTGAYTRLGQSVTEAPALFKRGGVYYLTYSDPNCGYCSGTGTSYRTASSPLGPWSAATKLTTNSCGGQPAFVSAIPTTTGTAYLYASDLWDGAHNEALADYYWSPLSFAADGSIAPITCQNSFSLALATGAAGAQNPPPGVDQADGTSGFRTYCDLRTGVARFQTFVPSRGGTLSAVSYTTFQSGNPNAGLEFDVYRADGSSRPTGTVLSSTVLPASSIGWSPRAVTITPNVAVTAGVRYGFLVKSVASSGCYGLAYSDAAPYPGGGEAYSGDGGSTFSAEAGRSLKFSTSVTPGAVPAASATRLPAGFTWCATESGTCSTPGSAATVVAFGAGSYLYKTVTGGTACTASAFGGDPVEGVLKSCYIAPSGGPSGYTRCAAEDATCSFSGTEMVAYGGDGGFNYQLTNSSIACSNSNFGDPMPGLAKSCYLPPAGAPAGSWTTCASENGSCAVTGTQLIAYGANGAFVYSTSNGPIACSNTVFGADPVPGVAKTCYAHGAAPTGFGTQCATENGTCAFSGTQTVAYGTGGEYVYKTFTGGTPCDLAAFGTDPVFGVVKSCYLTSNASAASTQRAVQKAAQGLVERLSAE